MGNQLVPECSYGPDISWEVFSVIYNELQSCTSRMVGKTMEVVEALGLPQKQEDAAKKILKERMWEIEMDMDSSLRRLVPEDQIPTIGGTFEVTPPPPVI